MAGSFDGFTTGGGSFVIVAQGLRSLDGLGTLPEKTRKAAVMAINRTLERGRTSAARRIREQVNLPASYLNRRDRLGVTKKAQGSDLKGVITGRHRPTSLARFARGGGRRTGVMVEVQPGLAKRLQKAFFIKLRAGNTDAGPGNTGLAIRLPAGKRPDAAYKPTLIGKNLWLLYGPSIDQVFDDVAGEMTPETLDFLEAEFTRLMGLK